MPSVSKIPYDLIVKKSALCNGHGHLYDDSSAPSLHGKNREIGAKEVNIKVSMPFIRFKMIKLYKLYNIVLKSG